MAEKENEKIEIILDEETFDELEKMYPTTKETEEEK